MKRRRRRFQADISEELFIAIATVCERLAVSKVDFAERALVAAVRSYCESNPDDAAESLVDLLHKAEGYLVKQ